MSPVVVIQSVIAVQLPMLLQARAAGDAGDKRWAAAALECTADRRGRIHICGCRDVITGSLTATAAASLARQVCQLRCLNRRQSDLSMPAFGKFTHTQEPAPEPLHEEARVELLTSALMLC